MTAYRRGDVVLVNFVFANEHGIKRRPAVIVSAEPYQQGRQEVIMAAITSNVGRLLVDCLTNTVTPVAFPCQENFAGAKETWHTRLAFIH